MARWKDRLETSQVLLSLTVIAGLAAFGGCMGPNYAQIDDQLRAKNLQLEQDLNQARSDLKDTQATLQDLRNQTPRTTTLSEDRLAELFTVGHVEIRKTSDAWDLHDDGIQDGFRVFIRTTTADGIILPATGKLTVQAVELPIGKPPVDLGQWVFTAAELKPLWYGGLGLNQFGLNCPWKLRPSGDEVTFKVQFVDALTGRTIVDQAVVKIHLKNKS